MTDEVLIAEAERLREALKEIVQSCTSTPVALNDGFGTCVVTAPSMDALRKASEALKPPATKPEPDLATRVWDEAHAAYLNHQKTITIGRKDAVAIICQALSEAEQRGREAVRKPVPDDVVEAARWIRKNYRCTNDADAAAHALADYILKLTEKGKGVMLRFDICYSPEELEEMVRIGKVRKCANCDTILGLSQNCECGFS